MGRSGKVFHLDFLENKIHFLKIVGVKQLIHGNSIFGLESKIRRKMHIAVPEFPHSLIILTDAGGVEDAGIFSGKNQLPVQMEFHRGFQQKKQIIAASAGAVDTVTVIIGTVELTVIDLKHLFLPPKE